jgi:transcription initiation factor TFIIIB Brf1 subunit/transcription initiation factor TFIIB
MRRTSPEVRALMEEVSQRDIGHTWTHDEFERIIGSRRDTDRYRTVLATSRNRMLREWNVWIDSVHGVGYKLADRSERIRRACQKQTTGMNMIAKAVVIATTTAREGLSDEDKRVHDHFVKLGASMASGSLLTPTIPIVD